MSQPCMRRSSLSHLEGRVEMAQPTDAATTTEADPCLGSYAGEGTRSREVHFNFAKSAPRVYRRMDGGYDYVKFNGLKFCPVTLEVAKAAGWCHKHRITKRIPQSSGKGLLNFVVLYLKREVGFHSEQWMKDGEKKEIPGEQTAGRIRIIDERSAEFYELVQEGERSACTIDRSGGPQHSPKPQTPRAVSKTTPLQSHRRNHIHNYEPCNVLHGVLF